MVRIDLQMLRKNGVVDCADLEMMSFDELAELPPDVLRRLFIKKAQGSSYTYFYIDLLLLRQATATHRAKNVLIYCQVC